MPITELQKLSVPLVAPVNQFGKDLQSANKLTDQWGARTRSTINSTAKAFTGIGVGAVAGLAAIFGATSRTADELGKLSDKLGEVPQKLSALQRAGELTGVGVETTNMALQRMVRRVAEAGQGTGEAVGALEELNLSAKALAQLSPAEQFKAIADAMGGVTNQGDRVRLAMKLFDSEGVSLVNTLALGSEGLREIEEEMSKYGESLSRIDIAKIEAANDEFTKAKGLVSAFGTQFTAEFAPIVGHVVEQLREAAQEAGGFGEVGKQAAIKLTDAFAFAADAVNGLKVVFLGVKTIALSALAGPIALVGELEKAVTSLLSKIPGIEVDGVIDDFATDLVAKAVNAQEEFQAALLAPPPSEKIKATVRTILDEATAEAEAVAAEKQSNIGASITDIILPASAANDEDNGLTNPFSAFNADGSAAALEVLTGFLEQRNSLFSQFDEEKNANIIALEEQLSKTKDKLEKDRLKGEIKSQKTSLKNTKSFFAQGFSDLAGNSKKAFELQKSFRIAETVQNTYSAAMGAYNALAPIPTVGPALGAAAAAAAIAFGAQQISAISSSQPGGSTSVGGGSPGSVSASGGGSGTVIGGQPFIDDDPFVRGQQESGTTINFFGNVSSNDPQRFAEDLKALIDDGDFVLIENSSRNGLELGGAAA